MNIYEKMILAKHDILASNMKKSGKNTFSNYDYFELTDILPAVIKAEIAYKFLTCISFTNEYGILTVINAEDPKEVLTYTCPMSEAQLKGCHPVQNSGAVQTYLRRYLLVNCFGISEHDAVDSSPKLDSDVKQSNAPVVRKDAPKTASNTSPELVSKEQIAAVMAYVKTQEDATKLKNVLAKNGYDKLANVKSADHEKILNAYMETLLPFPIE